MTLQEYEDYFGKRFNFVTDYKGKEVFIDKKAAIYLLMKKEVAIKYKQDLVFFAGGNEGTGKSTWVRQAAKLLDPTFNEKRIVYDKEACMDLHYKLPDWSAIVLDESQEGLDRRSAMSQENKRWNAFMRQSRQSHKFLFLVGPSIYDIDSYVSQHRIQGMFYSYFLRGRPGYCRLYTRDLIRKLFVYEHKARTFNTTSEFNFRFSKNSIVDLEEYNRRKKLAFDKFKVSGFVQEVIDPVKVIQAYKRERVEDYPEMLKKNKALNIATLCRVLGVERKTVKLWLETKYPDQNFQELPKSFKQTPETS